MKMKTVNILGREFPYDNRYSKRVSIAICNLERDKKNSIYLDDIIFFTESGEIYYYMGQGTFEYLQSLFPELKKLKSPYKKDPYKEKRILDQIKDHQRKIKILKKDLFLVRNS